LALALAPALTSCSENKPSDPSKKDAPDRVIAQYNEAIQRNPGDANAYYMRGVRYDELGDPDKAVADYSEAIRLKDVRAYSNRAAAYQKKHEYDKAIADYTAVIEGPRGPGPGNILVRAGVDAKAYYGRGTCYDAKGETDKAVADYKEVAQRDLKLLNDDLRKRIGK
jgi:hypothetical protein